MSHTNIVTELSVLSSVDDTASSTSFSYSVSQLEAKYYTGLPSNPPLVYRTSTTPWKKPTGLEAYRERKELRAVFGHKIVGAWKDLGPKVVTYLDSVKVMFTSIDVVRFAKVQEGKAGPVVLWIGVIPKSLFGEDAHTAAQGCLAFSGISTSPTSMSSSGSLSTLGWPAQSSSNLSPTSIQLSTFAVLLPPRLACKSLRKKRLTLKARAASLCLKAATAKKSSSLLLATLSSHRTYAHLLATSSFSAPRLSTILVTSIKVRIGRHGIMVEHYALQLWTLHERETGKDEEDAEEAKGERKKTQTRMDEAREAMDALNKFHDQVTKYWAHASQRILGHVVRSPRLTLGAGFAGLLKTMLLLSSTAPRSTRRTLEAM